LHNVINTIVVEHFCWQICIFCYWDCSLLLQVINFLENQTQTNIVRKIIQCI